MTSNNIEPVIKSNADALAKTSNFVAQSLRDGADAVGKGEKIATSLKSNADAAMKTSQDAFGSFQELAKAYQEMASRNTATVTASIQALAAVKSPMEFFELQRKLISESVETTLHDINTIAKLTSTAFTGPLHLFQRQAENMTNLARK